MKVLAIVGQKGGCGKTTLAENLAGEAASHSHSVALIDLDSQPTAAGWGDRRQQQEGQRDKPAVASAQVARLRQILDLSRKGGAQLAVLDTPPRTADATIEAARSADLVLIPVRPLINDVETLPALKGLLQVAGNPKTMVVLNAAPVQGGRHEEARKVAESHGFVVCPVVLHHRNAFGDAPLVGQWVGEFDPDGKAADEIAALYRVIRKAMDLK